MVRFTEETGHWQWQGDAPALLFGDPGGLTSIPSLRGKVIADTRHGMEQWSHGLCRMDADGYCNHVNGNVPPTELRSNGVPLVLCRADGDYPQDSLEATGLTGAWLIEEAWQYYLTMPGTLSPAPPLTLQVFPRFHTIYEVVNPEPEGLHRFIWSLTDNAAWGLFNGQPTLLIFPPGQRAVARGNDRRLWQIPFIMSHELGHHVFDIHYTGHSPFTTSSSGFIRGTRRLPLDAAPLPGTGLLPLELRTLRDDALQDSWSALGEAFADLFAWYAGGEDPDSLFIIDVLKDDRDVSHPAFRDGHEKVFTERTLGIFLGRFHNRASDEPNWADEHVAGAIWARGWYAVHGGDENGPRRLLEWLDAMVRQVGIPPYEADREFVLKQALIPLVEAAEGRHCAEIRRIFGPLLAEASEAEIRIETVKESRTFPCRSAPY